MTKKATKRVIRKRRQLKKQVKRQQQQEQQQRVMQPMIMGYGHQMYGNADGTMQQLRNQNQSTIDQINSMTSALRSLENFKPFHYRREGDGSLHRHQIDEYYF